MATGRAAPMTRADLTGQEEHLFAVLSGKRFLQMEGLSNEVPFFIYPYNAGGRAQGRSGEEADQEQARHRTRHRAFAR